MTSYSPRSDSGETQSSTLSEFVRKRWTGQTPVMGGDPRVGATEFVGAAGTDLVRAMNNLTGALQGFGQFATKAKAPAFPVTMNPRLDNVTDIEDALRLDDKRIEMLLSASIIEPQDIQRYVSLFASVRDSLQKKAAAVEAHALRKSARTQSAFTAEVSVGDLQMYGEKVQAVADIFGLDIVDDDGRVLLLRAITHDSFTNGYETNRVLAHIGDSSMKLVQAWSALDHGLVVSDVSDLIQQHQTNTSLRMVGVKVGLERYIRVGGKSDATAKGIMATVVEAVLGVAMVVGGIEAVKESAARVGIELGVSSDTPRVA